MPELTPFRSMAAAAALLVALTACDEPSRDAAAPRPEAAPVEVAVATVEARRLPVTAELPGRTTAFRVAEIRPQVDGIIRERLFTEGGEVTAGQPLYRIDSKPYEAALASAAAELQKAEANVAVTTAKARRYRELLGSNAVSRQNYDDAVAAQKQAEADAAAARASIEAARINLDYTTVESPISGRIGKSAVSEGALVTANQSTALAVVQQIDPIYVDLSQSLAQLARLRRDFAAGSVEASPGSDGTASVTVTLDAAGTVYAEKGELLFSEVTVEPDTSTVELRAVVPNPRSELLPGMFVRARVEQGVREDAILVPQQAVFRSADGSARVWLLDGDNRVAPHAIETDRAVGSDWLVTAGLTPGDRIVVEGLQKVQPGARVTAAAPAEAIAARRAPDTVTR